MPDAASFGDPPGADTLGNIARRRGLHLPNMAALGLGNIKPLTGIPAAPAPTGAYGRCTLASPGKDTTTGHWEMVGIHLEKPFPLCPNGFPPEIMEEFERRIGRHALGNKAASGTEIIQELGAEHMRTGSPIVYTSADSVFQVAAHEEVIPLWELYKICETAREILRGPAEVGRVIARPFIGTPGHFTRTTNRHDYAVPPPPGMLLDRLDERGVNVHSVGKIFDVFLGRGRRRPDLCQPGRLRPAIRASQRYRWLWRRARTVRRLASSVRSRAAPRRPRHLHRRPRLRPHGSRHRPHARIRASAGLRSQGPRRRGSRTARVAFRHRPNGGCQFWRVDCKRRQLFTTNFMRKPIMAGNWKMYKTPAETTQFL